MWRSPADLLAAYRLLEATLEGAAAEAGNKLLEKVPQSVEELRLIPANGEPVY